MNTITIKKNDGDPHNISAVPLLKKTAGEVFASLGHQLTYAKTSKETASFILTAAKQLFGWHAATFDLYHPETKQVLGIVNYDTVNGEQVEIEPSEHWRSPSVMMTRTIVEGPQLLTVRNSDDDTVPFGNLTALSRSIMMVPIKNGIIRGIVSVQSYEPNAFGNDDLATLLDLAVQCAGAIERIQAVEMQQSSEVKMRAILETNTDWISLLNPDGSIIYGSPSVKTVLGYQHEDLVGKDVFNYIHPDDVSSVRQIFRELLSMESGEITTELRLRKKDGSWCRLECRGTNKINVPGINAIMFNARDITVRKRMEEDLQTNEIRYRAILDAEPECVKLLDEHGRLLEMNRAGIEMLGAETVDQLLGKDLSGMIESEFRSEFTALNSRVFRGESGKLTFTVRTLKGVLRWFDTHMVPLRDHSGAIIASLGITRDVTEKRESEKQLQQTVAQYRMMFDNNPLPIWACDRETYQFLGVNRAAVDTYGYSESEFLSMSFNDIHIEYAKLQQLLSGREDRTIAGVWKHRTKQGKVIDVELTAHDIEYNHKKAKLILAVDVTERIALEEQFRKAQKMESIGTLSGGVAHDFNNILGIVHAHASYIIMKQEISPTVRKGLDAIVTAANRGAGIVKQLLTFARKNEFTAEQISINSHIEEMKTMLSETLPRDIEIVLDLDKDVPSITADATQIQQVFLNLSVNARDAMPNGGTLKFTTGICSLPEMKKIYPDADAERYVSVTVSDTGSGMSDETRMRIFEPFFTTKEFGKGTGLGLSVVYGIVLKHNGFLDVTSAPGKGTIFTLYLPSVCGPVITDSKRKAAPSVDLLGTESILIVEDEELLRHVMVEIFTQSGYSVITAVDGEEALEKYRNLHGTIAVVISDIGLPKLGGHQLLMKLKEVNPAAKVIFSSGYIEPELKLSLLNDGACEFIGKPFGTTELLTIVRSVLNRKDA